ncbi:hypothetical protein [Carnobacterium funditum]|nr:hypothetical protein [Carnobacterium funditum]
MKQTSCMLFINDSDVISFLGNRFTQKIGVSEFSITDTVINPVLL